jgi:sugar/nucleoside kinase (ribokinase family)
VEPLSVAASEVDVQDTTGAGDAFCGAFLARWLSASAPAIEQALPAAAHFAVQIAATAVTTLGGRPRPAPTP